MIKDFDTPIWIPWSLPLIETTFIERPNRYIIHCRKEGSEDILRVHLPDPGRLNELLYPGVKVYLHHIQKEGRKTEYSAERGCSKSVARNMPFLYKPIIISLFL
ncbi:hypothetical protein RZN25_04225 [Bacillaceae bacterium S4-13-56]